MDPEQTLRDALSNYNTGEYKDCAENLMDYFRWRIGQGFEPTNGDSRAYVLLAKMGVAAETFRQAAKQLAE